MPTTTKFQTQGQLNHARILGLIERTGTWADHDSAVKNLLHGQPAFWGSQGLGNAPAGTFMGTVNMRGSIEAAQDELADHFKLNGRDVYSTEWLDYLLPINAAAVRDLEAAYKRARTFRSYAELERRTERFEGEEVAA